MAETGIKGGVKTVILGSARNDYVLDILEKLSIPKENLCVMAKKGRESFFRDLNFQTIVFKGDISPLNFSFLRALRKVKADVIVVAIGTQFLHFNIVSTLELWIGLFLIKRAGIYISYSFSPGILEPWGYGPHQIPDRGFAPFHKLGLRRITRTNSQYVEPPSLNGFAKAITVYDPVLGWRTRPVKITVYSDRGKTKEHKLWRMTISGDGARAASKYQRESIDAAKVAIFGADDVFSFSLSDEETFPWKLQELIPNSIVYNYASPGYSIYQTVALLEQKALDRKYDIALLVVDSNAKMDEKFKETLLKAKNRCHAAETKLLALCWEEASGGIAALLDANGFWSASVKKYISPSLTASDMAKVAAKELKRQDNKR